MNFKLTFTLAVLLLLAALGFMLVKKDKAPDDNKTPSDATPLITPAPKEVDSIAYLHDGTVERKFVKQGDTWSMTDPIKANADPFTVNPIADALKGISYLRKFEPEASGDRSAESTGTAKPHDVVKFTDEKGKEYTLALGHQGADGWFATFNGDKTIYVIQNNPAEQLDRKNDTFRNKQIKQVDTSKITRLDVKTDKTETHLAKIDGKWMITSPAARANSTAVNDIVTAFGNIQAEGFTTLKKPQVGVEPGVVTVTAWIDDSAPSTAPATTAASQSQPSKATPITLQLGYSSDVMHKDASPVYASIAGTDGVFTYSHDSFAKMNKETKDLRDPAVIPVTVAVATASDLTISTEGAPALAATHKNDKWTLNSTPPLSGDPYAISDYLGVIRDLRAINYVDNPGDLKSIGLDPPHSKIEITIPGQSQHEVLLVGKTDTDPNGGKVTAVMRQGEPTVYQVQSADADRLATSLVALRDKQVETLLADHIRKIEITGPDATVGMTPPAPTTAPATGTVPATTAATTPATAPALKPGVTLVRSGTDWSLQKDGQTLPADESKISALLGDFTPLMATKYLDDKPPQGTPAITLTITVLESALPAPATSTKPATAPATASATAAATSTKPATAPATSLADIVPALSAATVDPGKLVTHILTLYKVDAPATTTAPATAPASQPAVTWKAAWDGQSPAWSFEPPAILVEHLTKTTYNPAPAGPASSQPATKPFANP